MFSTKKRFDNAYSIAKVIALDDSSKFVLFSDFHHGNNSFADDFANNRNIYFHALNHYFNEDFQYFEIGDGDELWRNFFNKMVYFNKRRWDTSNSKNNT